MYEGRAYDLEERTIRFAKAVLDYAKVYPHRGSEHLLMQLTRAATSVAANYMEACVAESLKDFRHKCCLSAKEAKESWFWLRMTVPAGDAKGKALTMEALELTKIFAATKRTCDQRALTKS